MPSIFLLLKRASVILFFCLINIATLRSADPSVAQQILLHQQWVETHVPHPDTLNQTNLLTETAKAIITLCHEEQYIQLIKYAGERYALEDLTKLAETRKLRKIDKDDALLLRCLKQLWEKSEELESPSSYATAYLSMQLAITAHEEDEESRWIKQFHTTAKELYASDPSPQNEELWLFAQFLNATGGTRHIFERPLTYEQCFLLMADIIKFYARTHIISEVRAYAYLHLSTYSTQCLIYPDYYAMVNRTFHDKNDSILIGHIPLSYLTEQEDNGTTTSHHDLQKASIAILTQCKNAYHPDVISAKMAIYYQEPTLATNEELNQLADYCRQYFGENSLELATSQRIQTCKQLWEEHQTDNIDKVDLLFTLKDYHSETSSTFINVVAQEMAMRIYAGQNQHALNLANLLHALVKEKYPHDPIRQLAFREMDWYFQRTGVPSHATAFDDQVKEYLAHCTQHIDFETIGLGKYLAKTANEAFHDRTTALLLQRQVLLLLQEIMPKTHPLFVCEYLEYGRTVASAYPSEATTLDGEDNAEALYADIIACARACGVVQTAFTTTGNYYLMQGNPAKARTYYSQAIGDIEKSSADKQLSQVEKDSNRYYLASDYAYILTTYTQEGGTTDSIAYYEEKLLHEFADGFDFLPGFNSHIHEAVVACYMRHNQIGKAEQLLTQCLEYYDKNPNQAADGFYTKIIQALVQIYGNAYSDMDKSLRLAERIERDIDKIKDFGNFQAYIDQLRILYDLIEFKNPYNFLQLNKYYTLLEEAIGKYVEASKNNETVAINYGIYLATKKVAIAAREPLYRAMAMAYGTEEEFDAMFWSPIKKSIMEELVPLLLNMKTRLKQLYPTLYGNTSNYQQILMNLAIATQRCTDNPNQAEPYFVELAQCNERGGLPMLGDFYLETQNMEKAIATFARIEQMLEEDDEKEGDTKTQGLFANIRGEMYGRVGMAYYMAGKYDQAMRPASIYYEAVQQQIEKNFDLFTQEERQAFLLKNGNSAGGTLLRFLLPHRPDTLSPVVYDIMLKEKGLLLRASERIHASILSSGNDTLIHALDSLHTIRQQLEIMTNNNQDSQEQFHQLRDKHERLERYIVRASEPYRKKTDEIPTWEQVRNHLKEGEACIEYVITDSAALALVLTPHAQTPQCVPLMNMAEMEDVFDKVVHAPKNQRAENLYEKNTAQLYTRLWQPIEKHLGQAHTIYYSPTGFLNAIAFAAIPLPDGQFLIDRYDLHQLTTTARLALRDSATTSTSLPQSAHIYGSIFYSHNQKTRFAPLVADIRQHEPWNEKKLLAQTKKRDKNRGAIIDKETYPFLLFTLPECDAITQTLTDNHISVEEYIGELPTEREIRRLDGQSPDILHISTHGFFYGNPKEAMSIPYFRRFSQLNTMLCSGLVLAHGEETWQQPQTELSTDNILSAAELASLDLSHTRLAVLSACETGLGSFESDGVFGLQRGLKQAGVKAICASLWNVNDFSTSQFMQSFYNLWIAKYGGTNMQKSMKEAMLEQRKRTPSPYHWAPFVLYDADF